MEKCWEENEVQGRRKSKQVSKKERVKNMPLVQYPKTIWEQYSQSELSLSHSIKSDS